MLEMAQFSIVGRKFSATEFSDYIAHLPLESWKPTRVVLHNTANPSLKSRPNGLTNQHIQDLHYYYQFQAPVKSGKKGWSGGPHLFVDQLGIWVFNPLDRKGTHSPSFNANGWGVEMLGDYETEAFDTGDGLKVQENALGAVAGMFRRLGIAKLTETNFKFHYEDLKTDHACPGKNVKKSVVLPAIQALLDGGLIKPGTGLPIRVVVYRKGGGQSPVGAVEGQLVDGSAFADAQALAKVTGVPTTSQGEVRVRALVEAHYLLNWHPETSRLYLVEN